MYSYIPSRGWNLYSKTATTLHSEAKLEYILDSVYDYEELFGMKIIKKRQYNKLTDEEKKETNYLVLEKNNMFFCLNDFKTSRKYSEKCIELSPELKKVMRFY